MDRDIGFPIEIVRTKRKRTVCIEVERDNSVRFIVPQDLPDAQIESIIVKRRQWIERKLRLQAAIIPLKPKAYVDGDTFTYLGRNYRLKIIQRDATVAVTGAVKLKHGYLQVSVPPNLGDDKFAGLVRNALRQWYERHAWRHLSEKTERYGKLLSVQAKSIKIRDYKSRWGACSAIGDISYNWRIIMAPHDIVDYLVVHELCHILQHDHSPKYWRYVEYALPNFKVRRAWLRQNSRYLSL